MAQSALKTDPRAPTLKVVEPTAAQRLRQQQEAIRAEAATSLADLLGQMQTLAVEARGLSDLDTYTQQEREALKAFATNTEGTLRVFRR